MKHDRWQQIERLFHAVPSRAGRDPFLTVFCAGDEELRAEVESLLAESECADDFLSEPLLAAGLSLLDAEEAAPDIPSDPPSAAPGRSCRG